MPKCVYAVTANWRCIEVAESVIEKIAQPQLRRKIVEAFRKAGFLYVSLDLEGFRSGSMNDTLTDK